MIAQQWNNDVYQSQVYLSIIILMSQSSINPKQNRTTDYKNLIKLHNNDDFFSQRAIQLKGITSYHMFPIDAAAIGDYPMIIYHEESLYSVDSLIDNTEELTQVELKALIWQITKLMLDCQKIYVNHFRLCPKAITLKEKYKPSKPFFVRIKDFSLGKEFQTIKQGKTQEIFQYLHPDLSILNKIFNFGKNYPQYDIWSLGIILYKLIYFQNPFHKSGKTIFSKTILREYLSAEYQIKYPNAKYESVNKFIKKCLSTKSINQFKNWQQIKKYILEQQQIYHQLDFHDGFFEQMAQIHLKSMIFFSNIYCLIIEQCRDSPNPFWRIPISNIINIPFQILICQFTLTFMKALQQRFYNIYSAHIFLLKKQTFNQLYDIGNYLKKQLEFKQGRWTDKKLDSNVLTKDILLTIQDVCVKMKFQGSEENQKIGQKDTNNHLFDSRAIIDRRSAIVRKKRDQPYTSKLANSKKVWKTVQILYDYCSEVLDLVKQNNLKTKYVFQVFYINSIFDSILKQEFHYKRDFLSIFKRIYRNYLNQP